jgi:hypothetical protein
MNSLGPIDEVKVLLPLEGNGSLHPGGAGGSMDPFTSQADPGVLSQVTVNGVPASTGLGLA